MKILFLCRFLPHPKVRDSGGQDTYHYIADLSTRHTVSLIAFVPHREHDYVQTMRQICSEVIAVPYDASALSGRLWRAWWRMVFPRVYGRVFSVSYRQGLQQLVRRSQFDVMIVDGMMAQYGLLINGVKCVLDEVDIYSTVAYHTYLREKRPLQRLQDLGDWLRTHYYELDYARRYDGIVTRSQKDRAFLQELLPEQNIGVLQPWFEGLTDELRSIPVERPPGNGLLFVGAMNNPKNVEAVVYFVQHIFPLVRLQVPDAVLCIVGGNPTSTVRKLAQVEGVQVTGTVEDLTPYYTASAVNVVPLLAGGGIITKTLNGMAAARPTVSTLFGISGTGAEAEQDIIVADSPQDFAHAVVHLLQDEAHWFALANRGRDFVAANYDWHRTIQTFESFIYSVLQW